MNANNNSRIPPDLPDRIRAWGKSLGFQQIGFTDTDLSVAAPRLASWVAQGFAGQMDYMWKHGEKRWRPADLVPGTLSVISARMDYLPPEDNPLQLLQSREQAFISRYALGRDYHKLMRNRLQKLAEFIQQEIGAYGFRVFVDSAPVLEKPLAEKAGLGWIGKHSNLVNSKAGSWFFLGEIYTDLALPPAKQVANHCGSCVSCMDCCPTQAIVRPYVVDARRCISYLTIEHPGEIPEPLRPLIGNRIYGCDDCLLACPWNKFARPGEESDFLPRNGLDRVSLENLFRWSEQEFLDRLAGSPIRRIGYQRWQRNLAVALGNSGSIASISILESHLTQAADLVTTHIQWAIKKLSELQT